MLVDGWQRPGAESVKTGRSQFLQNTNRQTETRETFSQSHSPGDNCSRVLLTVCSCSMAAASVAWAEITHFMKRKLDCIERDNLFALRLSSPAMQREHLLGGRRVQEVKQKLQPHWINSKDTTATLQNDCLKVEFIPTGSRGHTECLTFLGT